MGFLAVARDFITKLLGAAISRIEPGGRDKSWFLLLGLIFARVL